MTGIRDEDEFNFTGDDALPERLQKLLEIPTVPQPDGKQCALIVRTWLDSEFKDFRTYREGCHAELFASAERVEMLRDRDFAFGRLANVLVQDPELPASLRDAIEYCIRMERAVPSDSHGSAQAEMRGAESSFVPEALDVLLGPRNYPKWTLLFEDGESSEVLANKSSQAHLDLMHLVSLVGEEFPNVLKRGLLMLANEK